MNCQKNKDDRQKEQGQEENFEFYEFDRHCPRCGVLTSRIEGSFNIATDEYEDEATCLGCGLRFYPENIYKCNRQDIVQEHKTLSCPNCSGKYVKRSKGIGTCATCGFKWDVEEFLAAEAVERAESAYYNGDNTVNIGVDYEYYVADRLKGEGYTDVVVTRKANDHGGDVIATDPDGKRVAIQCKMYSGSVGKEAVQQAYGAKGYYNCDIAMAVTNSYFTPAAKDFAEHTGVILREYFK